MQRDRIILSSKSQGITAAEAIGAALFVIAIILAGSDGPYFPWPNLIGCGIAIIVGILASARN